MPVRKKWLGAAVQLVLLLVLAGCVQEREEMVLQPTEFSQETADVLNLFGEEVAFFDYCIDDRVKSYSIDVWVCQDGKWTKCGKYYGNTQEKEGRFAIRITESGYDLFEIVDSGFVKSHYPDMPADFSGLKGGILSTRLSHAVPIQPEEEILLWIKAGMEEPEEQGTVFSIEQNEFRKTLCDVGFAVTATFFSDPAE